MQKEFEKHQKLEHLNDAQKKEYQQKLDEEEKAKRKHEQVCKKNTFIISHITDLSSNLFYQKL